MGLETVAHITDLVTTNPPDSDDPTEGAAHLRNIKTALKADFPNITGIVGATQAELDILDGATLSTVELNYVDGVTSSIQSQIDAIAAELAGLPGLVAGLNAFQGFKASATQILSTAALIDINTSNFTNLTAEFDTDTWFDINIGSFTPDEPGYYEVNLMVRGFGLTTSLEGYIYKNGFITDEYFRANASATGHASLMLSAIHYMNGAVATPDYLHFRLDPGLDADWSAIVVISGRKIGT